jgi:hypothetical protein
MRIEKPWGLEVISEPAAKIDDELRMVHEEFVERFHALQVRAIG